MKLAVLVTLVAMARSAGAQPRIALQEPTTSPAMVVEPSRVLPAWDRWGDFQRRPAIEVNVLWPFFPGGLFDLKAVIPVLRSGHDAMRGELILGLHSDFGWRGVRAEDAGKVAILATKVGWRQFFSHGVHADVTVNAGWRSEKANPYDGTDIDGFVARLWNFVGWQLDLTPSVYVNTRAGVGIHVWRSGPFGDREKRFSPAGDLNLGFRW